jgi:hypothetical protein
MKTLTLFILTAFFVTSINAQQNRENIISNNNVLSIAMHGNYLWLGTENGIVNTTNVRMLDFTN